MKEKTIEKTMRILLLISACTSIAVLLLICIFMLQSGAPAIKEIGFIPFLFGNHWAPEDIPPSYGIFPMIMGSLYVTAGSILFGVPVGLMTAIYMSHYCNRKLYGMLHPAFELLAGIPSIVYGFFGMTVLVPFVRTLIKGNGNSVFTASILLGIMILPTIIGISESALRAIPDAAYQGALALGATHEQAIFKVVLPAAKSGIMAGVLLGIGRAVGETMAVIMISGNQARMPKGVFEGVRTLTANIVLEMGYASGLHRGALLATGVVLFVFVLIINICFSLLNRSRCRE